MQASQTLIPDHQCSSCFSNRSQEWLNIESVHEKLRTEIGGLRSKVQWLQQGLTHVAKLALTMLRYFSNLFWENSLTRTDCKYGRVKTNGDVPLCDKARSSQQQKSQTQTNVPLNRHTYPCTRSERSGLDNPQLHKTRTDSATGY